MESHSPVLLFSYSYIALDSLLLRPLFRATSLLLSITAASRMSPAQNSNLFVGQSSEVFLGQGSVFPGQRPPSAPLSFIFKNHEGPVCWRIYFRGAVFGLRASFSASSRPPPPPHRRYQTVSRLLKTGMFRRKNTLHLLSRQNLFVWAASCSYSKMSRTASGGDGNQGEVIASHEIHRRLDYREDGISQLDVYNLKENRNQSA